MVTARWARNPRVHALTGSNPNGYTFDNLDFVRAFSLPQKNSKPDEPFLDGFVSALVQWFKACKAKTCSYLSSAIREKSPK